MNEKWARMGIKTLGISLVISVAFAIANVCYACLVLFHSYPMSVYPASIPFLLAYFLVKKRPPLLRVVAAFSAGYVAWTVLLIAVLDPLTPRAVDYNLFFEPFLFLAVLIIVFFVRKAFMNKARFLSWWFMITGLVLVGLTFYCMMPGNMLVTLFDTWPGGQVDLLDTVVPASTLKELFLLYHVPVLIGSFGSAAFFLGLVSLYAQSIRIEDLAFFGIVIGTFLSVYVIGIPMVWYILVELSGKKTPSEKTPSEP